MDIISAPLSALKNACLKLVGRSSNCIHGFLRCPSVALLCCLLQGGLHLRCLCASLSLSLSDKCDWPGTRLKVGPDQRPTMSMAIILPIFTDLTFIVAIQESPLDQSSWLQRSSSFSCRFLLQQNPAWSSACFWAGQLKHRAARTNQLDQIGPLWVWNDSIHFYPAFESCS